VVSSLLADALRLPTTLPDMALACADEPDLWFAESPADVEAAKARCHGCPIQPDCLQGALERGEPWGVWGGQLVLAGEVVARKRPRGRPRKNDPLVA
jgi:WhiB family redox-sensing transcriptional regulator